MSQNVNDRLKFALSYVKNAVKSFDHRKMFEKLIIK